MPGPYPFDEAALDEIGDWFLRWHTGAGADRLLWRRGRGVAVVVPRRGRFGCLVLADPPDSSRLLEEVAQWMVGRGQSEFRVSLPLGNEALRPDGVSIDKASRWEWMWTDTAPDGDPEVTWLGSTDLDDVAALLGEAMPDAHVRPGDPEPLAWAGVRQDGRLVACGALTAAPSGRPFLRSIVTKPDLRGHGLGTALTVALTRRGLTMAPVVSLGVYSDNAVARRIYHRLGYRTSHHWVSARARIITTASVPSA